MGRVIVQVAYSFISSGTEARNVDTAEMSLVRRARQQPEQVKQFIDRVRLQGPVRAFEALRSKLEAELPLGYSSSGTVVEVGRGVDGFKVGQEVACGGAGWADHTEVASVPQNLVVPVPDGCSLRDAASVSLGAIALQGVRRADVKIGETAAVIGLGLVGQLTAQLVTAAGGHVLGVDPDPRRTDAALRLGASRGVSSGDADVLATVAEATEGHGVDAAIVTAASLSDDVIRLAMQLTRRKGKVVIVGDVGLGLARSPFYEKELDVLMSCSYGPGRYDTGYEEHGLDYPFAYVRWTENRNMMAYLKQVASGRVSVDALVEGEFRVDEGAEAFDRLRQVDDRPLALVFRHAGADRRASASPILDNKVLLRSKPSQDRIAVAVVGAGEFANAVLLPHLARLDEFDLRAVMARTGRRAQAGADRFSAGYATTSFEDVLADPGVDAVILCTRHDLHASQVVQALTAGKHVYCEKPLALTDEGLDDVLSTWRSSAAEKGGPGPILTVGFNRRFAPAIVRMRSALRSSVQPMIITYRVNAGPLPADHWIYSAEGGGRIVGEACHMLDLLLYLVDAEPIELVSSTPFINIGPVSKANDFTLSLRFDDGSIGELVYTSLGNRGLGKERIEVAQAGRSFVVTDFRRLESYGYKGASWRGRSEEKGHKEALQAFAKAVRTGEPPIPAVDMERSTRLSFLADRAVRTGLGET